MQKTWKVMPGSSATLLERVPDSLLEPAGQGIRFQLQSNAIGDLRDPDTLMAGVIEEVALGSSALELLAHCHPCWMGQALDRLTGSVGEDLDQGTLTRFDDATA